MSTKILSGLTLAALTGVAMLAPEMRPATAFTLSGPGERPTVSANIDQVYYRAAGAYHGAYHAGGVYHGGGYAYHGGGYAYHGGGYGYRGGYGYHPYGYGYGGAAAVGAAALGAAAIGAAVAAPRCWINNYGVQVCN